MCVQQLFNRSLDATRGLFIFSAILVNSIDYATADSMHANSHLENTKQASYSLPDNIKNLTTLELNTLKSTYENTRQSNTVGSFIENEQEFLNSLLAYDDIRLRISKVITELVEEYKVTGKYKLKLLGFADTFENKIKPSRDAITTLDEYKTYGVHFSVAYISMIYTIKENEQFYERYKKDIRNPDTTIGQYINALNIAYKEVEKAQYIYLSSQDVAVIDDLLSQLENEIILRQSILYTQRRGNPL